MATDQKIENLLNLALDATPQEREKSLNLDVGYDGETNTWDLIVKYTGSLQRLQEEAVRIVELSNEYAIVTISQDRIEYLAAQPEIEYIEKPKRLFFSVNQGRTASCMNQLQAGRTLDGQGRPGPGGSAGIPLVGRGIIIAVIDSGECVIILSDGKKYL